ncbi:MAG: hypothetical protein KF901_20030 [Myxococcales bacterium]|nr:hypothetical protein [Myxococcales bacterium]
MRWLVALVSVFMVACGGSSTELDAGVDAGAEDAAPDTSIDAPVDAPDVDAGPCPVDIREGEACAPEGRFCGGESCTDACSFCNVWECRGGRWGRVEVFPAPCFDCGDERRCQQDVEYCQILSGGAPPGFTSYECRRAPDGCGGVASCACVDSSAGDCDESGDGVIVRVFAP